MPDPEKTPSPEPNKPTGDPSVLDETIKKLNALSIEKEAARKLLLKSVDLEGVAAYVKEHEVKSVIFMCGAGISVNAGIPDFRSPKTGIFSRSEEMELSRPEDAFDIEFFRRDPAPFYALAKELLPWKFKPTKAHCFMKVLQDKDMLLRCYTQNIDSLEAQAGLNPDAVIAAHGNFDDAHCIQCKKPADLKILRSHMEEGNVMKCTHCGGYVKPDIVFFGESLPARFFEMSKTDFRQCDLLIVMGSSLVVEPFCWFVDHVRKFIPRLLINMEWAQGGFGDDSGGLQRGADNTRDAFFQGDCDEGVTQLAEFLGFGQELQAAVDTVNEKTL